MNSVENSQMIVSQCIQEITPSGHPTFFTQKTVVLETTTPVLKALSSSLGKSGYAPHLNQTGETPTLPSLPPQALSTSTPLAPTLDNLINIPVNMMEVELIMKVGQGSSHTPDTLVH